MRYLFDFHGTLSGNNVATVAQTQYVLSTLVARGDEVVVWSGAVVLLPDEWIAFFDSLGIPCYDKSSVDPRTLRGVVVVDDDEMHLRLMRRFGATPVHAEDILTLVESNRDVAPNPHSHGRLLLALCPLAERDHRKSKRQYAHTCHRDGVICICVAFHDLPDTIKYGILLHELGHLIDPDEDDERKVDRIAEAAFGVKLKRVDHREYGNELEWVAEKDVHRAALVVAGWVAGGRRGRWSASC